jgi:hypothetical protein
MANTKCIRYTVDPCKLNAGIPVEQLEKQDECEFQSQETMGHLSRYALKTDKLHSSEPVGHYPKPQARCRGDKASPTLSPEIELTASDYNKILSGSLIKLPPDVAKYQGKKTKLVNKDTGSYVIRVLILVGDRGYWR